MYYTRTYNVYTRVREAQEAGNCCCISRGYIGNLTISQLARADDAGREKAAVAGCTPNMYIHLYIQARDNYNPHPFCCGGSRVNSPGRIIIIIIPRARLDTSSFGLSLFCAFACVVDRQWWLFFRASRSLSFPNLVLLVYPTILFE